MEDIILKVMSIDKEANEIMKHAHQDMEKLHQDMKDKIEAMRNEIIEKKKCEARELYDSIVGEAESKAEKVKSRTMEECGETEKKYLERKEKMEEELFARIFI